MVEKRVPTQFLDLKSQDFGPRQEEAGSRIQRVGKPPPTELIEIHPERVRKDSDVLADLDQTQGTFAERSRRWARNAVTVCITTWDSAMRAARDASRSLREAAGHKNGTSIGRAITLQSDVMMQARAEDNSPPTVKLSAGSTIIIYPEIDTPGGWLAARAPSGELGYLLADRVL